MTAPMKTEFGSVQKQGQEDAKPRILWKTATLFTLIHVGAFVGIYYYPLRELNRKTLYLFMWQWVATGFAVTIGYHRLYSHRAFRATLGTRIVLAWLGAGATQGSIKWWALRHRLHHRFTDDPIRDPYAATRGLVYSHFGWIFYKTHYTRLDLLEKDDLENEPVVAFQHKYYVPLSILSAFVFPALMGSLWGDAMGTYIWAGLFARVCTWHCTFLVNSLAHWDGLQPYSDENTSRSNLLVAIFSLGEGNHNFHSFPHDFRAGPALTEWDPCKWIIVALSWLGLVSGLRRVKQEDIAEAVEYMKKKEAGKVDPEGYSWTGEVWTMKQLETFASEKPGRCVVLIDGYAVDVTSYLGEHPGGATLLRRYSVAKGKDVEIWREAEWAFHGGLNNHGRAARKMMVEWRVAKVRDD